ncbi:MAG TPA: helix-turn-helix domain-containing protein [Sporichthyaceae bacterium]|nr:helix-turn-helix domain-containing protein [Sporichthyaceae bacterium]
MASSSAASPRSALLGLVPPPTRADARRNYEALLSAASEVFGADGPDASLDEIARRAGVGNATLYRHFPTRRDLLVAVCVEEVEGLCALGERLAVSARPAEALVRWLTAYVEHVSSKQGLGAAMMTGRAEDSMIISACHRAVQTVGDALLKPAQQAGEIRADLEISHLLRLINAVAMAAEPDRVGDGEHAGRLLDLVLHGILSGAPRPLARRRSSTKT